MNQIANLAEAVGADVHTIAQTMGMDGRISPKFLHPGPGYGGSCFPKDARALAATGDAHGIDMSLIKEVVAFKAETDDVRDSPAVSIVRFLLDHGAQIHVHDPRALSNFKRQFGDTICYHDEAFDCLKDADCTVILTEWNEYRNLDMARAIQAMKGALLIDTRNVLSPDDARSVGFTYSGTGR